jgi:hypothetical protein
MKFPDWLNPVFDYIGKFQDDLLKSTAGDGRSVTRFAYLWASIAAITCGVLLVVTGIVVYLKAKHTADGVYWAAVTGFWLNLFGFVTALKMRQSKDSKDIAVAQSQASPTDPDSK